MTPFCRTRIQTHPDTLYAPTYLKGRVLKASGNLLDESLRIRPSQLQQIAPDGPEILSTAPHENYTTEDGFTVHCALSSCISHVLPSLSGHTGAPVQLPGAGYSHYTFVTLYHVSNSWYTVECLVLSFHFCLPSSR